MARYIDANVLKEKILKERDSIQLTRIERYSFGVGTPDRDGNAMRGGIRKALRCMEQTPTADVVPKSEVEALQEMLDATIAGQETLQKSLVNAKTEVERWRRNLEAVLEERAETKQEVAREIFEEIEKHGRKMQSSDFSGEFWDIAILMSDIAELKKKYTEGNDG